MSSAPKSDPDSSQYGMMITDSGESGEIKDQGEATIDTEMNDIMSNDLVEIIVIIADGKSFKSLIDSLKQIFKTGTFIFDKSGFRYNKYDSSLGLLIDFYISSSKLSLGKGEYSYSSKRDTFVVELSMETLKNNLSQIGPKDGIRIYKPRDGDYICFQHLPLGKVPEGEQTYSIMNIPKLNEIDIQEPPEYVTMEISPIISTSSKLFKGKVNPILKAKSSNVSLTMDDRELIICGMNTEQTSTSVATFSSEKPKITINGLGKLGLILTTLEKVQTTFSTALLKFLSKVGTYSGDDKLNFYLENEKPIKVLSTIKNYGTLRIYIERSK